MIRIESALKQLRAGKISTGKAAEQCGLSLWEMLEILKYHQIDWTNYSRKSMKKDLAVLKPQEYL